jgi:hypothetical protein
MQTIDYILPNWTIGSLFYSDESGLTDEESAALDMFIEREMQVNGFSCFYAVDCKEDCFRVSNDLDNLGADCSVITFNIGGK